MSVHLIRGQTQRFSELNQALAADRASVSSVAMEYVVIARWTALAGEEQRVRRILSELTPAVRAESGCRLFQPAVDRDDPRAFTILEIYDDEAAFVAHGKSPHFRRYVLEEAVPLLEKRERSFLQTIDVD
jgi:quinol monooxygenase YgiN